MLQRLRRLANRRKMKIILKQARLQFIAVPFIVPCSTFLKLRLLMVLPNETFRCRSHIYNYH